MILGERTKLVIRTIQAGPIHVKDLIKITGIEEQVVKNIISELTQAQLINRDINNILSVKTNQPPVKHADSEERNEWSPYKTKLKNLSRIV